jgi:hypothetical protein
MRPPPAPIVSAALSGLVVGVVVTLLATGVMHGTQNGQPVGTLPPATATGESAFYATATRIISRQLGPGYPDQKQRRLMTLYISPAAPERVGPEAPAALTKYRSVYIAFRLNDHPLGASWRLRAAKADVFAVMKALYTSQLPVYSVEMDGYFPEPSRRTHAVSAKKVLVAYIDHSTAARLPWRRWGREAEGRLWSMLTFTVVSPQFV